MSRSWVGTCFVLDSPTFFKGLFSVYCGQYLGKLCERQVLRMTAGDNSFDVFISYARTDDRHARDIDSELSRRGLKTFIDRRSLDPGLPWVPALEKAMSQCKSVVVLIGPAGFGNTQQYERDLAFLRQTREPEFPVVPVILPGNKATDP